MKLSFIIPCYNVSKTLYRCLDSVYALGLPENEFEVIAVDDASTDETLPLLEEYAGTHDSLRIIRHLVNRNLGAARNSGLAEAKGDCIAFVDSDDEVAPGMVEALRMMEERNLDMVALRVETVSTQGDVVNVKTLPYTRERVFSGIQLQEEHPYWHSGVCSYLYSKRLLGITKYPFVEGAFYEDVDFLCNHLIFAESVSYCDECGYRYIYNLSSITHTFSPKHVFGYAFLGTRMLTLYERINDNSTQFALSILEGGSYNLKVAFKRLLRLDSASAIHDFYNLLDSRVDRRSLLKYKEPSYCWTWWTRLGLRHRRLMTILCSAVVSLHLSRLVRKISRH